MGYSLKNVLPFKVMVADFYLGMITLQSSKLSLNKIQAWMWSFIIEMTFLKSLVVMDFHFWMIRLHLFIDLLVWFIFSPVWGIIKEIRVMWPHYFFIHIYKQIHLLLHWFIFTENFIFLFLQACTGMCFWCINSKRRKILVERPIWLIHLQMDERRRKLPILSASINYKARWQQISSRQNMMIIAQSSMNNSKDKYSTLDHVYALWVYKAAEYHIDQSNSTWYW